MNLEIARTGVVNETVNTEALNQSIYHSSISWRAIFAGTLISLLCYGALMSLGIAVGSSTMQGIIQENADPGALGIGSGIWVIASALIALFVGSYAAGTVSGLISTRVGRIQGVVITALFFGVMLTQIGSAIGLVGKGLGRTLSSVGSTASEASKNPQVQNTIRNTFQGLDLKSPPNVIAQGLATRLLQGDETGAKNYLADQANITPEEADRRLQTFKNDTQTFLKDMGGTTAKVVSMAGWTLFGALLLGTGFSYLGGGLGASTRLSRRITRADQKAIHKTRAA